MTVDALAVGAHPDDVELSIGGTIAKLAGMGHVVGILDLTRGEMGSRGTPEIRAEEARRAGEILGISERVTLDQGDDSPPGGCGGSAGEQETGDRGDPEAPSEGRVRAVLGRPSSGSRRGGADRSFCHVPGRVHELSCRGRAVPAERVPVLHGALDVPAEFGNRRQ